MAVLVFIIFLALLILAHEFGHFLAAKKSGVRVEEFGIGYPPRLFGFYQEEGKKKFVLGQKKVKSNSTIYSFNLLPFGGFVKIFGLDSQERKKEKGSFFDVSFSKRAIILLAGVLANFLIAWLFLALAYNLGKPIIASQEVSPAYLKDIKPRITQVFPQSPAAEAGLKIGDIISAVKLPEKKNWLKIEKSQDLIAFLKENKTEKVQLKIKRKEKVLEKSVLVRENPPENQGPMGIALADVGLEKLPFLLSFWQAAKDIFYFTLLISKTIIQLVKILFSQGKVIEGVVGPVGIVIFGAQFAEASFAYLLSFIGLLSLNLAILNLLPFPALDGGRLLFLFVEKIRRKPIPLKVENAINSLGFLLLIVLMILITFRDIKIFF